MMKHEDRKLAEARGATVVDRDPIKEPNFDTQKVYVWYLITTGNIGPSYEIAALGANERMRYRLSLIHI